MSKQSDRRAWVQEQLKSRSAAPASRTPVRRIPELQSMNMDEASGEEKARMEMDRESMSSIVEHREAVEPAVEETKGRDSSTSSKRSEIEIDLAQISGAASDAYGRRSGRSIHAESVEIKKVRQNRRDDSALSLDSSAEGTASKKQRNNSAAAAAVRRKKSGKKKKRRRLSTRGKIIITAMFIAMIALIAALILMVRAACISISKAYTNWQANRPVAENVIEGEESAESESALDESEAEEIWQDTVETITSFNPHSVPDTDPSKLISKTSVEVNGEVISAASYTAKQQISFDTGDKYLNGLEGIFTFRGNNFRDNPTYGLANMTENTMETVWSQTTGATSYNGKTWNGSGWTGQPLIRTWTKDECSKMNMYDWAKEKDGITEVIYATLDGHVYFLELESGEATRDALNLGFTFKGAGALDPRGYPILYLGAGYTSNKGKARVFIVNLLDCSVMYTFGNDDSFAMRGCYFFDSSALVDAETDTLIYPGESGVLYLIHLNTQYDPNAGTLSIDPDDVVKWNYYGVRSSSSSYWLGMEDSAVIYEGYLFIADNGGNFMCLDLNTLQLVWVQDTLDDTNCTPVMSVENGHPYLYISTSFHLGWRSNNTATIPIWKIDAETGEVIWHTDYTCESVEDVSGGVQSTLALGKKQLSDYIYVTVSRTGGGSSGVLTCLKKDSGDIAWEHSSYYAWSSPVCVYNSDGTGNVIYANCAGKLFLLDPFTGEEKNMLQISDGAVEASPAVFNDMLVIGTRAGKILGIQLK